MKDMVMDIYDAPRHAQILMRDLGITYQLAVPQSIGECWWFFNCENVPDDLPAYLSIRDFGDLNTLVGYGLSVDHVCALMAARKRGGV